MSGAGVGLALDQALDGTMHIIDVISGGAGVIFRALPGCIHFEHAQELDPPPTLLCDDGILWTI